MASNFVSRAIIMCLVKTEDRVKNFMQQYCTLHRKGNVFQLIDALDDFNKPRSVHDFARLARKFAETEYLTMGMTADAITVALRRLFLDLSKRPITMSTPNAELYAVLSKMPKEAREGTLAIKAKIAELDFKGKRMTYDVFVGKLEYALRDKAAHDSMATSTSLQIYDADFYEAGLSEDDEYIFEAAAAGVDEPFMCFGCGKQIPNGHAMGKCPLKCEQEHCGLSFCPHARDKKNPCTTTMARTLTRDKREPSAVPGKMVTPRMQRILVRKQEKYRAQKAGGGSSESKRTSYADKKGTHPHRQRVAAREVMEQQVMDAGLLSEDESDDEADGRALEVHSAEFMDFNEKCEMILGGSMDASAEGDISSELVQACAEVCNTSVLRVKPRTDAAVQQSGSPENFEACEHVSYDCTTERPA